MTLDLLFLFTTPGQSGGGGAVIFMVQMAAIVAIFYFLIIRPKVQQEKRHQERLSKLKRGDTVVTAGGLIGEIVHIKDSQLTLKSGESRILVQRERVAEVVGEQGQAEKKEK